jgi:hypothetical protein
VDVELDHTNEPHDIAPVAGTFTPTVTHYDWETATGVRGYGLAPYGSDYGH